LDFKYAKNGLARLALRWPLLRNRLAVFEDRTGEFEPLCAAYEEACQALDGWRRSSCEHADLRVAEYQDLVNELEMDLMKLLTSEPPRT
jgi:hypothetical protein